MSQSTGTFHTTAEECPTSAKKRRQSSKSDNPEVTLVTKSFLESPPQQQQHQQLTTLSKKTLQQKKAKTSLKQNPEPENGSIKSVDAKPGISTEVTTDYISGTGDSMKNSVSHIPIFKNPNYGQLYREVSKRARPHKNLKQILSIETRHRVVPNSRFGLSAPLLYCEMDAPPSLRPAKRYSDISGLESRYSDPSTGLRFSTPEEYSRIKYLPSDVVNGLLTLRKANMSIG